MHAREPASDINIIHSQEYVSFCSFNSSNVYLCRIDNILKVTPLNKHLLILYTQKHLHRVNVSLLINH